MASSADKQKGRICMYYMFHLTTLTTVRVFKQEICISLQLFFITPPSA